MAEEIGIKAGVAEIHQQGHFIGGQTQQMFVVVIFTRTSVGASMRASSTSEMETSRAPL